MIVEERSSVAMELEVVVQEFPPPRETIQERLLVNMRFTGSITFSEQQAHPCALAVDWGSADNVKRPVRIKPRARVVVLP